MAIKILQVIDNWYPVVDGVVNDVNNHARILNTYEGVECDVLCPYYPNTNDGSGNYKIIRCLSMSGGKFGVRLPLPMFDVKLHKYLNENHYDIIHVHSPVTLSRTVLRYAKKNNIPVLFTAHTKFHEEINRSVHLKCLQKFALNFLLYSIRRMDYVWSVSDGMTECMQNEYKIDLPCKTVRNGVEIVVPDDNLVLELKKSMYQKYDIAEDEKLLLFVGRVVVVKNISFLIESLKVLIDRGEKYRLVIVGDGDYKSQLEAQVEELGLQNKVIFAGMVRDKAILSAYYKLCDLFVFASTFDTFGLVTREAAAFHLPALFAKGSIASEQITDNRNGFIAELDKEKWADRIVEIFKNDEVLQNVKNTCSVELYKSWEQVLEEVLVMYKEIIKEGKRKPNK